MITGKAPFIATSRDAHAPSGAWALGLAVLLMLTPLATPAVPAPPPAGTVIDNTATATARDSASGVWVNPASNTVRAVVQALDGATLSPHPTQLAAPGASATFAHTLLNRGNAAATYRLTLAQLGADDFDAASLTLVRDLNGNGSADDLEPALADGASVTLALGESVALVITAVVPLNAPGAALARFTLSADAASAVHTAVTDTIRTPTATTPPVLGFWANGFTAPVRSSALGAPLFVQAEAPGCNTRPLQADTLWVTLTSRLTGDSDQFRAIETGNSTGIFRTAGTPVTVSPPVSAAGNDGVLQQAVGDDIEAVLLGCGGTETRAHVWIQPGGVVFDSRRNTPIALARVQLIDLTGAGNGGIPGGPASVLDWDGVTAASADIVTDAAGRFEFPSVPASTYRLVVTPPLSHTFPSLVAYADLPAGHALDVAGSFGGAFALPTAGEPVRIDVPVDGITSTALFTEKTASRSQVEWGDLLDYRVAVANHSDSALAQVNVRDLLPAGFSYASGTALANGAAVTPSGGAGPELLFALGPLQAHATIELRYRVRVGPGAPAGDALNRAIAEAGALRSNTASARVSVRGDAFADEAMLTGIVYLDADGNGRHSAGEPGLPGVRLYLDDGTFAVTDEHGRYSMPGLTPRTHALKLDGTTLPSAAHAAASDAREAGTPGLRFVDLTRGQLARADFAAVGDTTTLRPAHDRAVAAAQRSGDERARVLARSLGALAIPPPQADTRALPASRIITGETTLPLASASSYDATLAMTSVPPPSRAGSATQALTLEQLLPSLDPDLGFVGLDDLDTVGSGQIPVVVKARFGSRVTLRVNGVVQNENRIGRHFSAPRADVEAWEYIGVNLRPGINVLEVSPPRSLGRVAVRIVAPGPFAHLVFSAPHSVPADGHSIATLWLHATDSAGVAVGGRTLVTLDAPTARFLTPDLDPATPGWQTAIDGGRARIALVAPATPGITRVTAVNGGIHAAATVEFVPELRPLLVVGAAEGVLSLRRFGGSGASAAARAASFEAPMTQFINQSGDGRAVAAAHGALFMKGRLRRSLLFTLGWDSDREREQRQFRDLQPDRGFPVAGDAATRGYEAQSTGQLYARLEQQGAAVQFGDFVTGAGSSRNLGRYSRSLTGLNAGWERGPLQLRTFTSRDRSRRTVEELRGLGTSGPYQLASTPIVENSERIELIVRDRAQPSIVRTTSALQRFTDYELEPLTGRLLLRSPVPSVDADLNTVWLRISCELADGGAPAWVHGADARVRVTPRLELGGTVVDDHDPASPYELRGASAEWLAGAHTMFTGEWAATRHLGAASGDAARLELKHESPQATARAWGVSTSTRFDNPSAGAAAGRNEAGGTLNMRLAGRARLTGEAIFSADAAGHERRTGALLSLHRPLTPALSGELGVRVAAVARRNASDDPASAALRTRLVAQWPGHPQWSGYAEGEQDTRAWERHMAALGGEYRFTARGRLYARHELLSSLTSAWALSSAQKQAATVVGLDADVARDAHLFSEYRMNDAIAGREAQAAVGLRNGWTIGDGMRASTTFERVTPLAGSTAGPATALTASVDFTGDDMWKGSSRFEVRTSRASDQFLQGMAAAVKLDSAWTALGRQLLTLTRMHGAGGEARERMQLAFAYRPGSAWDALGRWEFRYDREAPATRERVRTIVNIAAFAVSVRERDWEGSFGWAGKLARVQEPGMISAGGAQWLHGRLARVIERDWDAGLNASVRAGRALSQREYGLGLELGRRLNGGTWLSLGWNRFGFTDDALAGEEWTRMGGYLRLRARFDERLFQSSSDVRP